MQHDVFINGIRYVPAPHISDNPELLDFVYDFRDRGTMRIRDYLHDLLLQLWLQQDGFSGKRPFGNSGWEYDLYAALGKAGVIDWDRESGDFIKDEVVRKANLVISALITSMCGIAKG